MADEGIQQQHYSWRGDVDNNNMNNLVHCLVDVSMCVASLMIFLACFSNGISIILPRKLNAP